MFYRVVTAAIAITLCASVYAQDAEPEPVDASVPGTEQLPYGIPIIGDPDWVNEIISNNIVQGNTTSDNTNRNINSSTSDSKTKIEAPPQSAIAPNISANNSDLCTVGVSAAVQTQILGISGGTTTRDMNCERLKLSKTLYDMGMKVAAISTMCQDRRVYEAMRMAGTPCPYEGEIGDAANEKWKENQAEIPKDENYEEETDEKFLWGAGSVLLLILLL